MSRFPPICRKAVPGSKSSASLSTPPVWTLPVPILWPVNWAYGRAQAWATYEAGQEQKALQLWRYLAKNEKIKARRKLAGHMPALLTGDEEASTNVAAELEQALAGKSLKPSLRRQYAYAGYLARLQSTEFELIMHAAIKAQQGDEKHDSFHFRRLYRQAQQQENRLELEGAVDTLARLQQSNLHYFPVLARLSQLHFALGQLPLARQYAEQVLAQTQNDRSLVLHKINLDIALGHFKAAEKSLKQLSRAGDETSEVIALYAKLARQQRDWDNALAYYRQLLTLELDNEAAHYHLAQIFRKKTIYLRP